MHFDYVDIGTCDFETSLDVRKEGETILLVEPLLYYLNKLPDGPGITKANLAVSDKKCEGKIYYVEEEDIKKYDLPFWIVGCNRFNEPHPTVAGIIRDYRAKKDDLPDDIIKVSDCLTVTFKELLSMYNIERIGGLKIDTEGHDHFILKEVYDCVSKGFKINSITFEYEPAFGNTKELDKFASKFRALGYKCSRVHNNIVCKK